jgi:hypothetical protein
MREGRVRGALGNTPDTSKGLRKLRAAGVLVRRGAGGRADPFRYMLKSAFLALSPEAQRAVPPPDEADDEADDAEQDDVLAGAGSPSLGRDAPAGDVDMAPCSAHDASDAEAAAPEEADADAESDGSTCDVPLLPPPPPPPHAVAAALTAALVAGADAAAAAAAMPAAEGRACAVS